MAQFPEIRFPRLMLSLLLVAGTAAGFLAGCSGNDDEGEPEDINPPTLQFIADGTSPVWMPDGEGFLFSYTPDAGNPGIFLSDSTWTIVQIWDELHNYDYMPSPDGSKIAFSTSGENNGVWVVGIDGSDPLRIMTEGRSPSWTPDGAYVVLEAGDSRVVRVPAGGGEATQLLDKGYFPKYAPQGTKIAYLFTNQDDGGGMKMRITDLAQVDSWVQFVDKIGTDFVWHPDGFTVFGSRLTDGTLSNVVSMNWSAPFDAQDVVQRALYPSVGNGGEYLLTVHLTGEVAAGIHLHYINSGEGITLTSDGSYAAASPVRREALVVQDDGIHRISW